MSESALGGTIAVLLALFLFPGGVNPAFRLGAQNLNPLKNVA